MGKLHPLFFLWYWYRSGKWCRFWVYLKDVAFQIRFQISLHATSSLSNKYCDAKTRQWSIVYDLTYCFIIFILLVEPIAFCLRGLQIHKTAFSILPRHNRLWKEIPIFFLTNPLIHFAAFTEIATSLSEMYTTHNDTTWNLGWDWFLGCTVVTKSFKGVLNPNFRPFSFELRKI